ncbi:UNVERIFIED_CONTAM: putative 3-hydroxyisobutyrate dehydrogenase, mitochondrial [Sesamum radiatum]|uniref:3-hydroxyisobutyrate dehydrogenase n=1 Tax=Sesamum radiatum TaxID=300843 RepID=A0AAW2KG72_SESRA
MQPQDHVFFIILLFMDSHVLFIIFPIPFQAVGFIGLGNMGSRMANNLIKAGYNVVVHDVNHDVMKKFSDKGILTKNSPLEVAEASDAVITMLPSSAHHIMIGATVQEVIDVYTGPKGMLNSGNGLRPWLFIDSSTIDPQTSRKLSATISNSNLNGERGGCDTPALLDAPVSGGVLSAETGSLTFMVGGSEEAYRSAKPLFLSMGKNIIYCGGPGNGSSAKICNNLAMAVSMLGVSEAFALGQSLGVAATTLTKIFNSSSARCWSSDTYNPVPGVMDAVPASRNYDGGFATKLMAKDLKLAAESGKEVEAKTPMTFVVAEGDVSAIHQKVLMKWNFQLEQVSSVASFLDHCILFSLREFIKLRFKGFIKKRAMSSRTGVDYHNNDYSTQPRGFLTPPPTWKTRRCPPVMPASEKKPRRSPQSRADLFHIIHKVPSGDSPYVRAKHVQFVVGLLCVVNWEGSLSFFLLGRQADRQGSKQGYFPVLESLDNILVELYKQSGRIEEEIEMLQLKLKQVEEGIAFGGKRTKMARSQGKKIHITVEKEYSRLLGNLAWAYMQQKDFKSAEENYRSQISAPSNKDSCDKGHIDESHVKSYERASQMLVELESQRVLKPMKQTEHCNESGIARWSDGHLNRMEPFGGQWDSGFYFRKNCDDNNGMQSSPLPLSVDKMKNEAFTEQTCEKRADSDWRTNRYQPNMGHGTYSACKRAYISP